MLTSMHPTESPTLERAPFGVSLAVVQHAFLHESETAFGDLPGAFRGYLVLGICSHQAPPTQAACAHQLGIDRTVLTYLVDDLEREKLVERTRDPNDRRARRIAITAKGARLLSQINDRLAQSERDTLRGLTAAEQESIRDLLWRAAAATAPDASKSAELAKQLGQGAGTSARRGRRTVG